MIHHPSSMIKTMKHFFPTLFLCLFVLIAQAQVPANPIGLNPPSLKWDQINTDKVQVIFPRGTDVQAQRVANVVHYLWDHHNESAGDDMHKVSIIMHNQTNVPNGFVIVGPFRSEFFLTSPQFNCATDWVDALAIHEYRHVKQFGNSRKGITKLAKTLLGSWTWGGFMATALPRWYFEGDAVGMETALTASGRGRLPAFDMEYRSLILNNIEYTYEKAAAGSLKDFVPDWYSLGYYMTTHARKHYGRDIWREVVDDAVRYKGLFFPFSRSLKKRTGLGTKGLYEATRQELDSLWENREKTTERTPGAPLNNKKKKTVTHYTNPHELDDGSVIVQKRGYNEIPKYYRIDKDGSETPVTAPGFLYSPPEATLSAAGRYLCWSELGFGLRWIRQDYSNIVLYDWVLKKKIYLTARSRYFSPALAPDGSAIVAVAGDEKIQYQLSILNIGDGSLRKRLPNPDQHFYLYPRWSEDAKHIAVVGQRQETHSILWIDAENGVANNLTPPNAAQLTHPYVKGEYVYFSSAYTGINNIFAVKIADGEIFQLTDDPLGAFQPSISPDGKTLYYSAFSPQGFDVVKIPLENTLWKAYSLDTPSSLNYYQTLVAQEVGGSILNEIPSEQFEIKKFNKWKGIINPHSILPFLAPPVYGFEILSDNKFSTLSASAGADYNVNDREWTFFGNLSYAELFPVVNLGVQSAIRSTAFFNINAETSNSVRYRAYSQEWRENRLTAGLSVPLNLSKGNLINRVNLWAEYENIQVNLREAQTSFDTTIVSERNIVDGLQPFFRPLLSEGTLHGVDLRFNWRVFQRRALQNINSRWGFSLDARYRGALNDEQYVGDVFLGRADFFFPGLSRNHSFYVNAAYQKSGTLDNYRYSDFFFYPRGYGALLHDELYKIGFNYSLPLLYPDLPLGPFVFLKRIKTNAFFDYGLQRIGLNPILRESERVFSSAGVELTFDFRALRLVEVDLGVRYSYLFNLDLAPNNRRHEFNFLVISITQ